jgi:dynein heavy chain
VQSISNSRGKREHHFPVSLSESTPFDRIFSFSVHESRLFVRSISNSRGSGDESTISLRLKVINDHFTYSLYTNVCMSLFEKDKLLFAFLLNARIMQTENTLAFADWSFLMTGGVGIDEGEEMPNPAASWLSENAWHEMMRLSQLDNFKGLTKQVTEAPNAWRAVYDSLEPHIMELPGRIGKACEAMPFMKVVILRCLRRDKVVPAVHKFVAAQMGQKFVEPPPFDLVKSYKESSATAPLLFVLSPGSDPTAALLGFADASGFGSKFNAISMGQGQGPKAAALITEAMKAGAWVLLQNCHLAPSWMPSLERICEGLNLDTVDPDFRLWMTSYPTPEFPVSVLQNIVKMTNEPPTGVRANLKRTYGLDPLSNDLFFESSEKPEVFKCLCFGLAFIHGFVQERRKFGPLGWNIPYGFDDGDLRISMRQLKMFVDENEHTPFAALKYVTGECNYGGRVTDDKDRRLLNTLLDKIYCEASLTVGRPLSSSGVYLIPEVGNREKYLETIVALPTTQTPEAFGLHDNADISKDAGETSQLLSSLMLTGSRAGGGASSSEEEVVRNIVEDTLKRLPAAFNMEVAQNKFPVLYEESLNQVLCQEMLRYNKVRYVRRRELELRASTR